MIACNSQNTKLRGLTFRALLTEDGTSGVRFERVLARLAFREAASRP
jgi:hypothetical protein